MQNKQNMAIKSRDYSQIDGKALERMELKLSHIEKLLLRLVAPASTLSVNEKAAVIRKALATGNKAVLKQTMKEINGE